MRTHEATTVSLNGTSPWHRRELEPSLSLAANMRDHGASSWHATLLYRSFRPAHHRSAAEFIRPLTRRKHFAAPAYHSIETSTLTVELPIRPRYTLGCSRNAQFADRPHSSSEARTGTYLDEHVRKRRPSRAVAAELDLPAR